MVAARLMTEDERNDDRSPALRRTDWEPRRPSVPDEARTGRRPVGHAGRILEPGKRLGTKDDLRASCGVSVGTFNEALRMVQARGLSRCDPARAAVCSQAVNRRWCASVTRCCPLATTQRRWPRRCGCATHWIRCYRRRHRARVGPSRCRATRETGSDEGRCCGRADRRTARNSRHHIEHVVPQLFHSADRRPAETIAVAPALKIGQGFARGDRNVGVERQPVNETRLAGLGRRPRRGSDHRREKASQAPRNALPQRRFVSLTNHCRRPPCRSRSLDTTPRVRTCRLRRHVPRCLMP